MLLALPLPALPSPTTGILWILSGCVQSSSYSAFPQHLRRFPTPSLTCFLLWVFTISSSLYFSSSSLANPSLTSGICSSVLSLNAGVPQRSVKKPSSRLLSAPFLGNSPHECFNYYSYTDDTQAQNSHFWTCLGLPYISFLSCLKVP